MSAAAVKTVSGQIPGVRFASGIYEGRWPCSLETEKAARAVMEEMRARFCDNDAIPLARLPRPLEKDAIPALIQGWGIERVFSILVRAPLHNKQLMLVT